MYVLALSDYKQPAAAAGYKPAPQLGRQIAVYLILIQLFVEDFFPCVLAAGANASNSVEKICVS